MASTFKFACPACGQKIEAPADVAGQSITCPICTGRFTAPAPEHRKRPFFVGSVCLTALFVAAAFGAFALWHRPNPAALRAMQIGKLMSRAEAGYDQAQFELATRYFNGERGVETNLAQAVNWYRKAAEQGLATAQNGLGRCYFHGYGVATNYPEALKWYRKAAEQGLAEGERGLGWCYCYGKGLPPDPVEGVKWTRKAADQGEAFGENNLGLCYETGLGVTSNAEEAVIWYRKAAEQGLPVAQCNLGICYKTGRGVASNVVEAVSWFRKAANQDDDRAQSNLGDCYANGIGVASNAVEAVKWYIKAAEHGGLDGGIADFDLTMLLRPEAVATNSGLKATAIELLTESAQHDNPFIQKILGRFYEHGFCVSANEIEAAKWYQRAAEQGNAFAQEELGLLYATDTLTAAGDAIRLFESRARNKAVAAEYRVEKNASRAAEWLRKAAEQGNEDAQYELGLCYALGEGVVQDPEEAVNWYRKAADKQFGNLNATLKLALCYAEGTGVAKDAREAVNWYRKAADRGSSEAAFYLGVKYSKGDGVSKDKEEAVRWYRKAAEMGDADALFNLGVMYRDGDGVERDAKEAFQWFQKSAEKGEAAAQCEVGSAYKDGLGVLQDLQQAAEWYLKAAKQGERLAQVKLGLLCKDAADRIEAYKWFSLAAGQGYENAKDLRDEIALKMSAQELVEARKRAKAFLAGDAMTNEPVNSEEEIKEQNKAAYPREPADADTTSLLRAHSNWTFKTLQGTTYRDATLREIQLDGITVTWDGGGAKIAFTNLPEDIRAEFHYDPQKAVEYGRRNELRREAGQQLLQAGATTEREQEFRRRVLGTQTVIVAEVFQVVSGGILAHVYDGLSKADADAVIAGRIRLGYGYDYVLSFVEGVRGPNLAEGVYLRLKCYPVGNYSYTTVNNSSKTIVRFTTDFEGAVRWWRENGNPPAPRR